MSRRARRTCAVALAVTTAAGAIAIGRPSILRLLARRHLSRAEELLARGEEEAGAKELSRALVQDPLQERARLLLGEHHLRRGKLERAFLELQAYADASPEDVAGWSDLAEVRLQAAQLGEAEAALSNAIDRAPENTDLRLRRSAVRLRIGRFHGASVDAQAALQSDPGSPVAQAAVASARSGLVAASCAPAKARAPTSEAEMWPRQLGELMREFGAATRRHDWPAADRAVARAREEYSDTMLGPWLEGVSLLMRRDVDAAERSFEHALSIAPRSHRPITNLVAVWSRQRGPGYAADRLLRLVDQDPQLAYPLPIAAGAYLEDAQPAKAEATIRRMLRMLPGSAMPYREVARFLRRLDRASDAVATADQGLSRFPADPELLRERALGHASLGDRESALESWQAALAARPDDDFAAAQLAILLLTARKDEASRSRAEQLVRDLACDAPSDPEVLGAIGAALLETGDAVRASRWLEVARDGAPESPQLRYQLAVAYARVSDAAGARRELQQALHSGEAFAEEPDARRLLDELEARR